MPLASLCSARSGGWMTSSSSLTRSPGRRRPVRPGGAVRVGPLGCRSRTARPGLSTCRGCCHGSRKSREMRMNYYGAMARRHWARWLPGQYAAIEDQDSFFEDLGNRASDLIAELADQFAGDMPPGEGYLDRAGRLGQARRQAEE